MTTTSIRRGFLRSLAAATSATASLIAWSCVAVDPTPEWATVQGLARERTGTTPVWQRTDDESRSVRTTVTDLLRNGLTRDGAVQTALLNNPEMQATYADIGVAKAQLVQAGLLTNPSLDFAIAFPLSNADSFVSLMAYISDLWTIPKRRAMARARTESEIRRVGLAVVDTAARAIDAYDEVVYCTAALELERRISTLRQRAAEHKTTRPDNRGTNDLAAAQTDAEVLEQQLAVASAERDLTVARSELDLILAVTDGEAGYQISDSLETPPDSPWTVQTALAFALQHRLDIAQARFDLEKSELAVDFERTQVMGEVSIGPMYEGTFSDVNSYGPTVSLDLPIFDQNQAQIAKAEYRVQQAQRTLEAAQLRARNEITTALADIQYRRQ